MESGRKKRIHHPDRRVSSQGEEKAPGGPRRGACFSGEESGGTRESPEPVTELPEVSFSSFILSLSTSALVHLGEVPDPVTQKMDKHLPWPNRPSTCWACSWRRPKGIFQRTKRG